MGLLRSICILVYINGKNARFVLIISASKKGEWITKALDYDASVLEEAYKIEK